MTATDARTCAVLVATAVIVVCFGFDLRAAWR